MRPRLSTHAALWICVFAIPTAALADTTDQIVSQCVNNGSITGDFNQNDFSNALENLPSDVDEYTDCRDVIRRRQLAQAGVGSSKRDPHNIVNPNVDRPIVVPATPTEAAAIKRVQKHGDRPVKIDGKAVTPGISGFTPASIHNPLPAPLLVLLFLLGFGCLVGTVLSIRARRHSRVRR